MEPKLILAIQRMNDSAIATLNADYRWFRLRRASDSEINIPVNLQHVGWLGYCACDGSGIYNYAYGPRPQKLTRRTSRRSQKADIRLHDVVIGGQLITASDLRKVLRTILCNSGGLVMALFTSPIAAENFYPLIMKSPIVDIDEGSQDQFDLFTETERAFRITQNKRSTNNPMDRSGGSGAS
jgi:hypothetical protein